MGKQHLACFRVDGCGVGLETTYTRQRLGNLHGEHGRNISLATSHDTLGIELGQGQTTRVVDSRQQVETANGEALQLIPLHKLAQRIIDLQGNRQGVSDAFR